MAKVRKLKNRVYTFTFKGLYAARAEDRQEAKPYEINFKVPETAIDRGALSLFCKQNPPEDASCMMARKYPDFIRLLTFEIVESSVDGEPVDDINLMNRVDLEQYIKENELPVLVELYDSTDSLRQAVLDCETNQEAFETAQAKNERKLEELKLKRELRALNSDVELQAESEADASAETEPKRNKGGRPPKVVALVGESDDPSY